jgi:nicotinamidase-related amidase
MMALLIVDMIKDNMSERLVNLEEVIAGIKKLIQVARREKVPIIYANDSFLPFDPFFKYMPLHAIRGTEGIKVIDELKPEEGDFVVEKRRFSAFLKTDLDLTLKALDVDTVAICGINTWACILFTAADAISLDFNAILIEDCCTSHKKEIHHSIMDIYKNFPMMEVLSCAEVIKLFTQTRTKFIFRNSHPQGI